MAPLRQQKVHFPNDGHRYESGPESYLSSASSFGAFDRLANIKPDALKFIDLMPTTEARRLEGSKSRLETLPTELLDMVLKDTNLQPADVIALGLASRTLWLHVAAHIRSDCLNVLGMWAKTPFVITGSYLTSLPPTLYQHYPGMRNQEKAFAAQSGGRHGPCPARRWNWAAHSHYTDVADTIGGKHWLCALDQHKALMQLPFTVPPETRMLKVCDSLRTILTQHLLNPVSIRSGSNWTLRNLTTKEYVQLHVQNGEAARARAPHIKGLQQLTVDKILVMRCSWRWEEQVVFAGSGVFAPLDVPGTEEGLSHHVWAGHCFDIVSGRDKEIDRDDWQDVTMVITEEGRRWVESTCSNTEVRKLRF